MTSDSTGNSAPVLHRAPRLALRLARRHAMLLFAVALTFVAAAPRTRADSPARQEKHARKMEKHLAKYRAGTLVQLDLRDSSVEVGSLGRLSDATFQIVNSDNNKLQTYNYSDVSSVKRGKEYIGAGSEPGHHIRRWAPILAGTLLAGGGIAAYETLH
jgi:hypothetical protein